MLEALRAHSNNELERAVGLYSQILRMKLTDSVRSLVYNHRGMAYFALSGYKRSLTDFSRALSLDGENVRCLNNRALTFRVLKRFHDSLEDYDRSLAINPSQLDAFWGRAQTCYELQLFTPALEDCRRALGIEPGFVPAQALVRRIGNRVF
jgi:putative GTP pyrophosphokinase